MARCLQKHNKLCGIIESYWRFMSNFVVSVWGCKKAGAFRSYKKFVEANYFSHGYSRNGPKGWGRDKEKYCWIAKCFGNSHGADISSELAANFRMIFYGRMRQVSACLATEKDGRRNMRQRFWWSGSCFYSRPSRRFCLCFWEYRPAGRVQIPSAFAWGRHEVSSRISAERRVWNAGCWGRLPKIIQAGQGDCSDWIPEYSVLSGLYKDAWKVLFVSWNKDTPIFLHDRKVIWVSHMYRKSF